MKKYIFFSFLGLYTFYPYYIFICALIYRTPVDSSAYYTEGVILSINIVFIKVTFNLGRFRKDFVLHSRTHNKNNYSFPFKTILIVFVRAQYSVHWIPGKNQLFFLGEHFNLARVMVMYYNFKKRKLHVYVLKWALQYTSIWYGIGRDRHYIHGREKGHFLKVDLTRRLRPKGVCVYSGYRCIEE